METKKWYQSTTIQGSAVTLLALIFILFKVDIDKGLITEFVTRLFSLIGTVMVIIGRVKASTKITK